MSDPKNENAGATPPEGTPAGDAAEDQTQAMPAAAGDENEAQTQAVPAAEAAPAQEQAAAQRAAASAEQPTAVLPPTYAASASAGPRTPWYRRRWAIITGSVAAGVILFLGGMAVGSTFDGQDRGGFGGDFHGRMDQNGGQGYGPQAWGDNGGDRSMLPPMGQSGQGYGHDFDQDGDDWQGNGQGGQGYGQPQLAPSAAPTVAPSTAPQAYYE